MQPYTQNNKTQTENNAEQVQKRKHNHIFKTHQAYIQTEKTFKNMLEICLKP